MPHSSGGGSHSGGYHHSSSSSSRSSSSSSSYSSSSSNPGWQPGKYHISRSHFAGSRRYVYYDRGGRYHNLYREGTGNGLGFDEYLIDMIVYTLIAFGLIALFMYVGVFKPKAIDLLSYNNKMVISDEVGLINETQVETALTSFQKKTGVTPSIELVYDSSWKGSYYSLEDYAYNEYLNLFTDEKHWLIVVSYPDDYKNQSFIDWSWEGMIGDYCSSAINSKSEDLFTETFHKHLYQSSPETLSSEIASAFNELTGVIMKKQVSSVSMGIVYIIFMLWAIMAYYMTSTYMKDYQYSKSIYAKDDAEEAECVNCGNPYIVGTVRVCPRCGNSVNKEKSRY